jgi:Protein of unknown function (DUF4019)
MNRKNYAAAAIALALSAYLSSNVIAQPSQTPDDAAKRWLTFVDGSDYAKSWARAGNLLKSRITAQDFQTKVAPVREPLGAVMERKLIDVKLSNTMPGMQNGKFATVQFNSRFARRATAVETIGLDTENGRWAVIGYFIK